MDQWEIFHANPRVYSPKLLTAGVEITPWLVLWYYQIRYTAELTVIIRGGLDWVGSLQAQGAIINLQFPLICEISWLPN